MALSSLLEENLPPKSSHYNTLRPAVTYRIHNSAVQRDLSRTQQAVRLTSRTTFLSTTRRYAPVTSVGDSARYLPCLMKSATRSPIIRTVTLMLARTHSGMIEASTTRRPSAP